ncbi:MAG: DnaJ domain-containing protein [Fusobacteriaceae bacterium]
MKNLYEILESDKNINRENLKKKYRELAKKYHPDKYMGSSERERKEAEKKFMEINDAYITLSDEMKRREYDKLLSKCSDKNMGNRRKEASDSDNIYEKFSKTGVNDLFKNFFSEEKKNEKEEHELKKKTNCMFESFFSVKSKK